MNTRTRFKDLPEFVNHLQSVGRYSFSRTEAEAATGSKGGALRKALWRLEGNMPSQCPRGVLARLIAFLDEHGIGHTVQHAHPLPSEVAFHSSVALTPLQSNIVATALNHDQGIIVAPSGSGKTIIGLELVARRKLPALILVHRKQIFD